MLTIPNEEKAKKTTKAAPKAATKVDEGAKAKAAAEAQAPVAQAGDVEYGNKSNTLIFMNPLGDPSKDDKVTTKDGKELVTATICGYRFKCTEDIDVPDCGLDIGFKNDRMNYVDPHGMKHVKAGETFDLTPFEMACLLSREEYNGKATGGDRPVTCTYNMSGTRSKDGVLAKVSDTSNIPNASLRAAAAGASIKDYEMINVINCKKTKEPNGKVIVERTPIAGFEKWAVLCQKVARKSAGVAGPQKAKRNTQAQAFLAIVAQKKKKAV